MFTFLHAADVHLDSPLRGLERYEGAPVDRIREATRRALENLVDLAIEQEVAFVLLAGDIYDGDWQDYNTALFLASQMARLGRAGINVYLIAGNHDAASEITRELRPGENVHRFPTDRPATVVRKDLGVAIHGQGFARRAVQENLAAAYPKPVAECFNIGLLHTSLTGRPGHETYAPCSVDDLVAKGYDYWALGHVHAHETVCGGQPWIVFPGATQGRHVREDGAKGCVLVTVDDAGKADATFHELDVVRWAALTVDCAGAADAEEAVERVQAAAAAACVQAGGRMLAARVELTGACEAHEQLIAEPDRWRSEIRRAVTAELGPAAWLEKIRLATSATIDADELARADTPAGDLVRYLAELAGDEEALAELAGELAGLRAKLPAPLREGGGAIDLESPDRLRALLAEARERLLGRLVGKEGAS